jgi:hypothetical protein
MSATATNLRLSGISLKDARRVPLLIDPIVLLADHLPEGWIAERLEGPEDAGGILVFRRDTAMTPTFLIYEADGGLQVATVTDWTFERIVSVTTFKDAADQIVAKSSLFYEPARRWSRCGWGVSSPAFTVFRKKII